MTNARLVILFLGSLALVSLGGVIYLVAQDKSIPDVLVATVSGSLAALGAILAKTGSDDSGVNVETAQNVNAAAVEGRDRGLAGRADPLYILVVALVAVLLVVVIARVL